MQLKIDTRNGPRESVHRLQNAARGLFIIYIDTKASVLSIQKDQTARIISFTKSIYYRYGDRIMAVF